MLQILILGDSRVAMMEKMYLEWKSRGVISPQDIFHFCINRGKTMEDFIAPLNEFRLKNPYNSIKMVVLIGFFNDYIGIADPDLGPDSIWKHKKLTIKDTTKHGEISPDQVATYVKQYIRRVKEIMGDVFVLTTTPTAIDCTRWVAKKAFGEGTPETILKMPSSIISEMNTVSAILEKHIRINVLYPLREAFATDVVLNLGAWWKEELVRGPDNFLKLPTQRGYVNIKLQGETIKEMATTDGIHPSPHFCLHFMAYLQRHVQFLKNSWKDCEKAPSDQKCNFPCQSLETPYPKTFCIHYHCKFVQGSAQKRKNQLLSKPGSEVKDDLCTTRSEIQDPESRSEILNTLAEGQGASCINTVSCQEKQKESLVSGNNVLITPESLVKSAVCNEEAEKEIGSVPKHKSVDNVSIGVESNSLEVIDTIQSDKVESPEDSAQSTFVTGTPVPPFLQSLFQKTVDKLGVEKVAEMLMDGLFN